MIELINFCSPLTVPAHIMAAIVQVESGGNPYAIGVVNGFLRRQPRNLNEAQATVSKLHQQGYNYSIGAAQINKTNFKAYNIDSVNSGFDFCSNIKVGAKILAECYSRSNNDWPKAFSCYYSGNFVTGFQQGYVQKVLRTYFNKTDKINTISIKNNYLQNDAKSSPTANLLSPIALNKSLINDNIRKTTHLLPSNNGKSRSFRMKKLNVQEYDNTHNEPVIKSVKNITTDNKIDAKTVSDALINDGAFVF
jgi:Transglycosylase SLT domain